MSILRNFWLTAHVWNVVQETYKGSEAVLRELQSKDKYVQITRGAEEGRFTGLNPGSGIVSEQQR
jgi:hypothetical protein